MEPHTVIGVVTGLVGSALLVVLRVLVVHCVQAAEDGGGSGRDPGRNASCRMHCGSDGANFEVASGPSSPERPGYRTHRSSMDTLPMEPIEPRRAHRSSIDTPSEPIEHRRSSMDAIRERALSYAQQYRHTLVRYMSYGPGIR